MKYPQINPKQNMSEIDEQMLQFWKENKTFEKSISSRPEEQPYRFYDGPPFITGMPHYGSLLSSIIKDAMPRYWTMKGKRVERVWWWDCHGLPIEEKVQKKLWLNSNRDIEQVWVKTFIEECYKYTTWNFDEWEWYIDHIGRWVDFKNSYKTMDQSYMESVLWVFKELYGKGLIYKWKRVSLYSRKLWTPISNFEVAMDDSYADINDPAITVMFDLSENGSEWANTYALAWTTTPWTIPANMALAINKECGYSKVSCEWKHFIVATNRIETVFKGKEFEIVSEVDANKLIWLAYNPPFSYYKWTVDPKVNHRIYHADFITDSDGTWIGHEAPEFGDVDFELWKQHEIFISEAMDDEGRYTSQISDLKGKHFRDEWNDIVLQRLKDQGLLFKKEWITHRVAMCPRTATPLVYKAQDSWFINIQSIKSQLLKQNEEITWFPQHLKFWRFAKWVESAPDWCISRTRFWWTPMPLWIWYDSEWNQQDMKVFWSIKEIEEASWMKVTDLHRPYIDDIQWTANWLHYKRVTEVLDVWMDSGSMPYAQVHYPFENKDKFASSFPADYIAEYVGQVRAWFYVMHVLWVALTWKPAFKNVNVTWVLAWNDGRKMSKSYWNYPDPKATILKYWADALRIYLLSSPLLGWWDLDFQEEGIIEIIKKIILPVWNTFYFFTTYANIDKFEATVHSLAEIKNYKLDNKLDIWIISSLSSLIKEVDQKMQAYDVPWASRPIFNFIDDLTNWYIRRSRRRFWKSENDNDKVQAYTTLYVTLIELSKLLAPFAPFITEYIFKSLTGRDSVHLEYFPQAEESLINEELNKEMALAQKIVQLWLAARTSHKIRIRQPLQNVQISHNLEDYYLQIIREELNVKEVETMDDLSRVARLICKPNAKLLWPKFGKDVQKVIQEAKSGNFKQLADGKVDVVWFILEAEEFELSYESLGWNLWIQAQDWVIVAIDPTLTQELILEWYARDLVRAIQEARKEADYNVADRISLEISWWNSDEILSLFKEYIQSETLSSLTTLSNSDLQKEIEVENKKFTIKIKR